MSASDIGVLSSVPHIAGAHAGYALLHFASVIFEAPSLVGGWQWHGFSMKQPPARRAKYFFSLALAATFGLGFIFVNSYIFFGPERFLRHALLGLFSGFGGLLLFRVVSPDRFREITRHFREPGRAD
jgi:hypothetical protein